MGPKIRPLLKLMMRKFETEHRTQSEGEFFEKFNNEGFALCKWAAQKDANGNQKLPARFDMIFVSCLSPDLAMNNTQVMTQLVVEGVIGKQTKEDGTEVLYF